MWRLVQKGLQCGRQAKTSFSVVCPDDVQPSHPINKSTGVIQSSQFHSSNDDSKDDGGGGENKWRMNTFRDSNWFHQSYVRYLEAMGWGSAVIAGIQVTDLYHRSHHCTDLDKRCWLQAVKTNVPQIDWSRFNSLVEKCSSYAASALLRTVLPSKYILPPSGSSNSFKAQAVEAESASKREVDKTKSTSELQRQPEDSLDDFSTCSNSSCAPTNLASFGKSSHEVWLHMAREVKSALKQNLTALELARSDDLSSAVVIWSRVCESALPDTWSLFNLAVCFQEGLGVDRDLDKASELYLKASDLGHAKSAYNLALLFMSKSPSVENTEHAMRQLEKASNFGLKEAQRELGVLYTELPRRDMTRAAKLFEKASAQQDASATFFLGICFEHGWGVTQNESKAASLYKLSSELGCREAWYNLAVFFQNGIGGLPLDRFEAVRCYHEAAKAGVVQAADKLSDLLEQNPTLLSAVVGDDRVADKRNTQSILSTSSPESFGQSSSWFPLSLSSSEDSDEKSDPSSASTSDGSDSSISTSYSSGKHLWQLRARKSMKEAPQCSTPDVIDKARHLLATRDVGFHSDNLSSHQVVSNRNVNLGNIDGVILNLGGSFGNVALSSNRTSCR